MVRYDCRFCGENVFDVVDIEHLGTLPHTWTCSGCQRVYIGELDDSGNLIVYQKGYKRSARVYRKPDSIEPAPAPSESLEEEPAPSGESTEEEPTPGAEESTEEESSKPESGEPAQEPEETAEEGE